MVSIVVCTHNDSEFLPRALTSCLIQNIEKEIILVDDCSTVPICDEVKKIIDQNKIVFKFLRHNKNMGLSAARNTGITNAKFDFVIPLDADDFFFPRGIAALLSGMDKDTDICYGLMTSSGILVHPYTGQITKEILLRENPLFSSSLFRKSTWRKVGGYKVREGAHYEDWNFWCRCFMQKANFKFVPTLVYEHTERPDSMLRTLAPNKSLYVKIATEELRGI